MAVGKCDKLKDHASAFMKPNQSHDGVNKHGLATVEVLYNCKPGNTLDFERTARFSCNVAPRSMYLPPETLPPTCDAARYHSYREAQASKDAEGFCSSILVEACEMQLPRQVGHKQLLMSQECTVV